MQTAGADVVFALAELGPRVQRGQEQLECRPFVLGMQPDGNAAAIVGNRDRIAWLVQRDRDDVGVAVEVFVHGVIDNFPDEVSTSAAGRPRVRSATA